ncbi:ABC transporter permease [Neolewinella sp.]|uniref:ABC transporter permease n=1 Tax=Neolewinella sp. TaxID=2993543 RepID=UPI003B51AE83
MTAGRLLDNSTYIFFALIVLVFSLLSGRFLSMENGINILVQAAPLAIVATGMTFVLLTAGIDLSVGSIMFLAGVVSAKLVLAGVPLGVATLAILGVGLLFGLVNAVCIYRVRIIPFIVTLATFYAGRGLGLHLSETRAINLPENFLLLGSARLLGLPLPVWVLLLVVGIAHLVLSRTVFGRQLYAVGNDIEKARRAGLPVERILLAVYLICGFCAALGGLVALSQLGAVSPTFGYQYEFVAIAAAVLGGASLFGGRGSVFPGTLIGALLIQSLQSGLVIVNADPYLYPLITGAVIFMIVMLDSLRHRRALNRRKLARV